MPTRNIYLYSEFPKTTFYDDCRPASIQWFRDVLKLNEEFNSDLYLSFGPPGLPVISGAYWTFGRKRDKKRADRILNRSPLGSVEVHNPLTSDPHFTYFMRPDADWHIELDAVELLKVVAGVRV